MKKLFITLIFIMFLTLNIQSNEVKNNFSSSIVNVPHSTASGINVLFRNRSLYEFKYNMQGIVDFTAYILKIEYKSMAEEFDQIGCELQFTDYPFIPFDDYYTREDMSFIRIKVPNENVGKAIVLTRKLVEKAKNFSDEDFEKAKSSTAQANMMRRSSLSDLAFSTLKENLFKDDYPSFDFYCRKPNFSKLELKNFIRNYFSSANTIVSVAGDINTEQINSIIRKSFISTLKNIETIPYKNAKLTFPEKKLITLEENKKQGFILEAIPLPDLSLSQLSGIMVVSSYLSEKLTFQLREREGLAYSMGAYTTSIGGNYFFVVSMATSPDKVDYAYDKINKIIKDILKEGIVEDELVKTKNKLAGNRLMRRLTNINKAFFHSINLNLNRPLEFEKQLDNAISDVNIENYKETSSYIDLTKGFTVLIK